MQKQSPFFTALPILLIFGFCAYLLGDSQLNHDTSWYLISTGWWLEGVPIYDQILELNPPLAYYLTVPPVFVAQMFDLDAVTTMKAYIFLIAAISVLWGHILLTRNPSLSQNQSRVLTLAACLGLLLIPLHHFAQREHLMVLFAWPYVALSFTDPTQSGLSKKHRVAVSLFSALGLAVKPYFLAIPLFITLVHCIQARSIRPAFTTPNITILAFCVLYVVASYVLHPAYFNNIIPQTVLTYDAYDKTFLAVFKNGAYSISLTAFAFVVAFILLKTGQVSRTTAVSAAACVGGLCAYFIQSKGWGYQMVPFQTFAFIFLVWLSVTLYGQYENRVAQLYGLVIAAATIGLILVPALKNGPYENRLYKRFAQQFTCPAGARSYQAFGSNVSLGFPLANFAQAIPANRAPVLWVFPGAVHQLENAATQDERIALTAVIERSREIVIDDFMRVQPQLVIVDAHDRKMYFQGTPFDYVDYFRGDARFEAAWKNYTLVDEFMGFQTFRREGCEIPLN